MRTWILRKIFHSEPSEPWPFPPFASSLFISGHGGHAPGCTTWKWSGHQSHCGTLPTKCEAPPTRIDLWYVLDKTGDDTDGHATDASVFQDEWMHVWSLLESLCQICCRCCESAASSCCFCKETREITYWHTCLKSHAKTCKNHSSKPWFPMIAHGFLWNCRLQSVTRGSVIPISSPLVDG